MEPSTCAATGMNHLSIAISQVRLFKVRLSQTILKNYGLANSPFERTIGLIDLFGMLCPARLGLPDWPPWKPRSGQH